MAAKKESDSPTANRELIVTRTLNAPVNLVWEVWTNPEHIKNWWGPKGFTNTITTMDVKPGGIWELVMHGPDGVDYKNKSMFKEVVKHQRIVFEHYAPNFQATITFTEEGNKTHLKWHMLFESKELFEQVVKTFKADEGLKQNIEKLENYLLYKQGETGEALVIERTYKAPVQKVWSAITSKEEMKKWYFDLAEFRAEVGFEFTFTAGNEEMKYVHLCKITEVIPAKKLSYSWRYEGHEGNSIVTFELFAEGDKTRLKLTHQGLETFPATKHFARNNFIQGWTSILGTSLKNYLEN